MIKSRQKTNHLRILNSNVFWVFWSHIGSAISFLKVSKSVWKSAIQKTHKNKYSFKSNHFLSFLLSYWIRQFCEIFENDHVVSDSKSLYKQIFIQIEPFFWFFLVALLDPQFCFWNSRKKIEISDSKNLYKKIFIQNYSFFRIFFLNIKKILFWFLVDNFRTL